MHNRKQQVLLTAQRLFVEKGFATTSVQDILDESGISKGTFYNYFSTKNECLIAILEQAQDVTALRQRELLIDQRDSTKKVLAEQIAIRLQVNKEQNLFMLFETIFHSKEQELRNFVKKIYQQELIWLAGRIESIYGEKVEPHALDCAVMLLGMLQNIIQIRSFNSKGEVFHVDLVHFVMRRMDPLIEEIIQSKDILFGRDTFYHLKSSIDEKIITKQDLITQLIGFDHKIMVNNQSGKEFIQFLLEELQVEQPRFYLIESISRSFSEAFTGTGDEAEAQKITSNLWKYIDAIE